MSHTGQVGPVDRMQIGKHAIVYNPFNGIIDESPSISRIYSETYEVTLSKTYPKCPSQVTVRVLTDFGAYGEAYDNNLIG